LLSISFHNTAIRDESGHTPTSHKKTTNKKPHKEKYFSPTTHAATAQFQNKQREGNNCGNVLDRTKHTVRREKKEKKETKNKRG